MSFNIVFRRGKLKTQEVADLLGVSRVTVSKWKNGHTQPHPLVADRVKKFIYAVAVCIKDGNLPLSEDVGRDERHTKLQQLLAAAVNR